MKTLTQQAKVQFARTLKARVRETTTRNMTAIEFKKEILRLLDNYTK